MAIIVKAHDDTNERKAVKHEGMQHLNKMMQHKKAGDHVEVTETIQPGEYTFVVGHTADGHVKFDLVPGKEK